MLRRVLNWFLLTKALDDARAHLVAEEQRAGAHLQQARLVAEVMKRVAEPAEALPPGNPAAILVALGREAVAAVLASLAPGTTEPRPPGAEELAPPSGSPDPLAQALDAAPPEVLGAAAPDPAALGAVKETLLARPWAASARTGPDDEKRAASVRAFVEALLWNADAPRRKVDRLLVLRFGRLALIAAALGLVAFGVSRIALGRNLAAGKPVKTSSSWSGCATDPTCEGQLLFHTNEENRPWAQFDLLKAHTIHEIVVTNRPDCCGDRIAPLVAEISVDGQSWSEVGRKNEEFKTWTFKFPPRQARYVKLRVDRVSVLHIKDLIVQ